MTEIDLSSYVPFELVVDSETGKIVKGAMENPIYTTRKLFDMKEVIYDADWFANQKENLDLYYMYREFIRKEDHELFQKHKIRFDITIIPPRMLGREYVKTAGHFHPPVQKGKESFPEAYEVMHGEAFYLLQKETKKKKDPIEIIIIQAFAGDQVLIPPGYGHVTVNPTKDKLLVMNNLVSSEFSSRYEPIRKQKGAAYLYHANDTWIRNPTYHQRIIVREKEPEKVAEKPFYLSFLKNPEKWKFLNEPWLKDKWL